GRLDVSVVAALRMCGIQSIGNFDSERQHHLDVKWFAGDPVLQCHAVQKLHGNESLTIFLADVVNRANILMIQSRRRLRLALETGEGLRVSSDLPRQELESDEAMQPRVLGLVDDAHPAPAQLFNDAVVRYGLAEHLDECYGVQSGMSMHRLHCSFAYSALACFRMGMSGAAYVENHNLFPHQRKSWEKALANVTPKYLSDDERAIRDVDHNDNVTAADLKKALGTAS